MTANYLKATCVAVLALSRSAAAQVSVTTPTVVEYQVVPGQSYHGAIHLKNSSASETRRALIYQTDYRFSADGSNDYAKPGTLARSNASWIRIDVPEVDVPPNAEVVVEYTVTVPRDSMDRSGSYWSMIMVEDRSPVGGGAAPARGVGVTTIMRYGVQIASHIAGTGAPHITFSSPKMEEGTITIDVSNTGNLACRPALRLELFGADGAAAATYTAQRGLLYPETSVRQKWDLTGLAKGTYAALLVADVGGSELFGVRYQIVR